MTENQPEQNRGLQFDEPLVFEKSVTGRCAFSLPKTAIPSATIDPSLKRQKSARLPEISELDVVRHFTRLSQWNFSIDTNFYPLGSCTMKYNPRINEEIAALPGFSTIHPLQSPRHLQGALQLIHELERDLAEITGMDATSLQPAAGAHGEFLGILLIQAYHRKRGEKRTTILIPDSAHGTNPASCTMAGYTVVKVPSGPDGRVHVADIKKLMTPDVAGLMMTNPNTLGLFESEIREIADVVHDRGGLVYGDGANLNALLGWARPGDLGIDLLHINLHKTFTTPHGGGGPGAGPVVVKKFLEPFLPHPRIVKKEGVYSLQDANHANTDHEVGRIKAFFGNFGMFVRAFTYIREMGAAGLKDVSSFAVLNANYIKSQLKGVLSLPHGEGTLHEAVFSDRNLLKETGVSTLDLSKSLIDYGFHPPTMYFPLVVSGAIMIEPTETESKTTLDQFCQTMKTLILKAQQEGAEFFKNAPYKTRRRRLDEAYAARNLKLKHDFYGNL